MTKREALAKVFLEDCLARPDHWADWRLWIGVVDGNLCFVDRAKRQPPTTFAMAHLDLDEEGWETKGKD